MPPPAVEVLPIRTWSDVVQVQLSAVRVLALECKFSASMDQTKVVTAASELGAQSRSIYGGGGEVRASRLLHGRERGARACA